MRIVVDLQACQTESRSRGIGRYSMALAKAMVRQDRGHETWIALSNSFEGTIEPIRSTFDGLMPQERIVVFQLPGSVAETDLGNSWRCRAGEKIRESFLANLAPDVLHVASVFEGLHDDAVTSVRPNGGFNTAVTLYDLIPLLRQEMYLADPCAREWYFRKLQALKNAGLLLAISEHSRREAIAALQLPEDRVITISTAADGQFRQHEYSREERADLTGRYGLTRPFLMYTGGIDHRKNIEGLIKSYALLPEMLQEKYQLAIVCNVGESDRRRLESLAGQFGVGNGQVLLTGFVTDEELVGLYNTCALFVFPSLHEGFGLPALEAMSCGAPVIGSNTSSIPEVIGRNDALFDPGDIDAMAAKIQEALTDEAFRDTLKRHGLEQAKRFSWDATANRLLDAFEHLIPEPRAREHPRGCRLPLPRLAFVSPLPPEKSGIADYSATLLPELARHYDIEVVVEQPSVEDPWLTANFPVRTVSWFDAQAEDYDRVLYQMGNSPFHRHMFRLLERHPGVVVLHDFFLGQVLHHMDVSGYLPGAFTRALYVSHGYAALLDEWRAGQDAAAWRFPCNRPVLTNATGVVVHSKLAMQLAETWYGAGSASEWQYIPLVRAIPPNADRQAARQRLGLNDEDFLVCSFGMLGPTKLNDRLLEAWLDSPLARDGRTQLVFIGESPAGTFGGGLGRKIACSDAGRRINITGFASAELYRTYLSAADVAVQLRSLSRGETSASILDCLSYGIPTIANANGWAAELPSGTTERLGDEFTQRELTEALMRLRTDDDLRATLSRRAAQFVRDHHAPGRIGGLYHDAIERFAADSPQKAYRDLVRSVATVVALAKPKKQGLLDVAASIAANRPSHPPWQLLVDASVLAVRDAQSGIQRVVRAVGRELLAHPPQGHRVEPVYCDAMGEFRYARNLATSMLGIVNPSLEDDPIEVRPGDTYLGLDLGAHFVPSKERFFQGLRDRGIHVYFVVYDLLPLQRPDYFPEMEAIFASWLRTVVSVADGVVCISRAVADELLAWPDNSDVQRLRALDVGYFHLGADIPVAIVPSRTVPTSATAGPELPTQPFFLMVGTVEPRKGYAQALAGFEHLWAQGVDANLVIVGKQGWGVEPLAARIRAHSELGKHLFWQEGADDELLLRLYASATAVLIASEGEGFGLPLVEAARHGLPIVARDIPVFREVAGDHAFYFRGETPDDLAGAITAWLELRTAKRIPTTVDMPWLTWAQSTAQLLSVIRDGNWYARWPRTRGAS